MLYKTAKMLGDIQAVQQSGKKGSLTPIFKRVGRRATGRQTSKLLGSIFR